MSKIPSAVLAVLGLSIVSPMSVAAACHLNFIVPQNGTFTVGKTTINLGEADPKGQPTAWLGPIKTGQCSFDPGIIEQPIAITPSGWLYVSSYSGSERMITLYNLKTCSIRWQSDTFAGKLELNSRELHLGDRRLLLNEACEPTKVTSPHKSARR
jgi:hypothetical protein